MLRAAVICAPPGETAEAAWSRGRHARIRHLLTTERGLVIGVVSGHDLGGSSGSVLRRGRVLRELMTAACAVVAPRMALRQAAKLMLEKPGRGFSRPEVRAQRRLMCASPAGARRKLALRRRQRAGKQVWAVTDT